MRREKILGMLILAMMLMFQTSSLMAQNKREFRGAWIQCVNGQYLGKSTQQHVADGSASDSYSHTTHKSAQSIIMLAGGKPDARKGKCKGSNELDDALECHH